MLVNKKSIKSILFCFTSLLIWVLAIQSGYVFSFPGQQISADDRMRSCKVEPADMNKLNKSKILFQMELKKGKLFVDPKNAKAVLSELFCKKAKCRKDAAGSLLLTDERLLKKILEKLNNSLSLMPYFDEIAAFPLLDYPKPDVPDEPSEDASDEETANYNESVKAYEAELEKREKLANNLRKAIADLEATKMLRESGESWSQYFKDDLENNENDGLFEKWRRAVEASPAVRTAFNELWKAVEDPEHEFFVLERSGVLPDAFGPAPDDAILAPRYISTNLRQSFLILTTDIDFGNGYACFGLRDPIGDYEENHEDPLNYSVEPKSEAVFVKTALREEGLVGSLWSQADIASAVADFYRARGIGVNVLAEANGIRKIIVERARLVFIQTPNLKENELYKVLQRVLPRNAFDELVQSSKVADGKKRLHCEESNSSQSNCKIFLKRKSEPEDAKTNLLNAEDSYIFFDEFLFGRLSIALKEINYSLISQPLQGLAARNGFIEYSWVIVKAQSSPEEPSNSSPMPAPTVSPEAAPSPIPAPSKDNDRLFANLANQIDSVTGTVLARFQKLPDNSRELEISIVNITLPDSTELSVVFNDGFNRRMVIKGGKSRLKLRSYRGDNVPVLASGAEIAIRQKGITFFSGVFGTVSNKLKPSPFAEATTQFLDATLYKICPRNNNWFYGGIEFKPRQGTKFFGGYKCLKAGPGVFGFEAGGFGEMFGNISYSGKIPFLKIGSYQYDLALSVNGSTDFERNRVFDGIKTNERRTGGTIQAILQPLISPASRGKAEIMFEINRQTVALVMEENTIAKQNLTTFETGFRYLYRNDSGLRFTSAEFKPRIKFGLGVSAGEKKFTIFSFDGHLRRDLNAFFVADLRGRIDLASRNTPIFEQPSFGAENTVRGFRTDDVIGRTLLSLQPEIWLRFRSFLPSSTQNKFIKILRNDLSLAFFYDVGGIYQTSNSFDGKKSGAGIGLRFDFKKQAVFKLDLAYGFGDVMNQRSRSRFYFTVELPENPF